MTEEKLIYVCLVCASNDIIQDVHQTSTRHVVVLKGCHCGNCGVKYVFNKGNRPNS